MAEPNIGSKPAGQRLVGQQRVDVHRNFGHTNAMTFGRDRRVQVGQRVLIIEPGAFRHKSFKELQHTVGLMDKPAERLARVRALLNGVKIRKQRRRD
ncbi:hypothetical protein ACVI1K_007659 [Bradyrhizobium sp. USDA 4508]